MKFRKKPVVIEAMQWPGRDGTPFDRWLTKEDHRKVSIDINNADDEDAMWDEGDLLILTLEGEMRAKRGDWVIRGVEGELYPCKPAIFDATYEGVTDHGDPA